LWRFRFIEGKIDELLRFFLEGGGRRGVVGVGGGTADVETFNVGLQYVWLVGGGVGGLHVINYFIRKEADPIDGDRQ
jgi:hypothetical protein